MSDVRKALEAAAGAVCEERNHPDYPCGRGDIDANIARAAVLAFLRAMPDDITTYTRQTEQYFANICLMVPSVPSRLVSAIEKETP